MNATNTTAHTSSLNFLLYHVSPGGKSLVWYKLFNSRSFKQPADLFFNYYFETYSKQESHDTIKKIKLSPLFSVNPWDSL